MCGVSSLFMDMIHFQGKVFMVKDLMMKTLS